MSTGTRIDVEAVKSVASSIRDASGTMTEAAAYAQEADPELYMWGAVGLQLAYVYFEATPHIHGILNRIPAALTGVADRIEASAAAVDECDQDISRGFAELENEAAERG